MKNTNNDLGHTENPNGEEIRKRVSWKNNALHNLCKTKQELEESKKKYAIGEIYNGSKIIDYMITKESEGMGCQSC